MKRWLVTTDANEDPIELKRRMADQGATVDDEPPVPLGPDEHAFKARGPDDLPDLLREDPAIRGVYPDSAIDLFAPGPAGETDLGPGMPMAAGLSVGVEIAGAPAVGDQAEPTPDEAGQEHAGEEHAGERGHGDVGG